MSKRAVASVFLANGRLALSSSDLIDAVHIMHLEEFKKEAPTDFSVCDRPGQECYKYCLEGKGCTLGVLFETSTCVCFEWLEENGQMVNYRPELRYKAWSKRKVAQLVAEGWWEPTEAGATAA